MVDVYSRFKDFPSLLFDHAEFTLLYHFVTSFAAFFMILAMVRKHKLATFWQRVNFIAAYSILGIFYSLVMSLEVSWNTTKTSVKHSGQRIEGFKQYVNAVYRDCTS
ncbi:hypothetical protein GCK32_016715 [Trichostrongylus colubriformis]|uniref:Uncharacterized protein n=1 Tax=Trichostrongylus colubriformis TaxID=6319 RepID=A0AAN8F6D4_TRICO